MEVGEPEIDASAFGLREIRERGPDGGPLLHDDDEDSLLRSFPEVTLVLGQAFDQGCGSIYITSRRLFWLSKGEPHHGYSVDFESISVHAISRDSNGEGVERPCIYIQVDVSGMSDGDDEPDIFTPELRLVPTDAECLQDIFDTMCQAAAANPDGSLEEDEGDFFYNEEEVERGVTDADREAMLERLDGMLVGPEDDVDELIINDPSRFEDPDDDEEEDAPGPSARADGEFNSTH